MYNEMKIEEVLIRNAYQDEWTDIIALVWKVFLEFEASDYEEEGVESFRNFITDNSLFRMYKAGSYQVMVALYENTIIGMIGLRNNTHISLLFVDPSFHRRGVGRRLIEFARHYLLTEYGADQMTVNASPYGIKFYETLGFRATGVEATSEGIRYTPMIFYL